MAKKITCECGNTDFEYQGSDVDENGEYHEYICNECGSVIRIYVN